MPVPKDPRVRFLRARIASATRFGDADLAKEARHHLDVILVEHVIRDIRPSLTEHEKNGLALVALGHTP